MWLFTLYILSKCNKKAFNLCRYKARAFFVSIKIYKTNIKKLKIVQEQGSICSVHAGTYIW